MMKTRIHFLDNLRTLMIFLVILYHAVFVYTSALESSWIVVDPVKNEPLGLIGMYLDLIVMFMLFFISGYFLPQSLSKRTPRAFIQAKFRRIMVPWLLAVFTLIPAYKVLFLFSRGLPQEEWFSYFHFFERQGTDLSFFANNPTQNWLWFLPVLFLFQLLFLPISKLGFLSKRISLKHGVIFLFIAGLCYSMVISLTGLKGWYDSSLLHFQRERLLVYFLVFFLGVLCYEHRVFESIEKNKRLYIISNVVLTISLGVYTAVALNLFFNLIDPGRNYFFISEFGDRIGYYGSVLLSMLSFLYILLYVFRFNFNKSNRLFNLLNRNSYQVYIVHMIVLGLIAMILVNIPMPVMVKYLLLTIFTFAISNLIVYGYNLLFERNITLQTATASLLLLAVFTGAYIKNQNEASGAEGQQIFYEENLPGPGIGIHEAIISGNLEAIKQHIKIGTDLNKIEPSSGSSPLITAATFGQTEAALILIKANADVNFKNNDGSTPLHTAAFFCRKEIVEALLANGADRSIKNNSGSTALESVAAPYEAVNGIYDYFGEVLSPLGLNLDYEQIKMMRPVIAKMLRSNAPATIQE